MKVETVGVASISYLPLDFVIRPETLYTLQHLTLVDRWMYGLMAEERLWPVWAGDSLILHESIPNAGIPKTLDA